MPFAVCCTLFKPVLIARVCSLSPSHLPPDNASQHTQFSETQTKGGVRRRLSYKYSYTTRVLVARRTGDALIFVSYSLRLLRSGRRVRTEYNVFVFHIPSPYCSFFSKLFLRFLTSCRRRRGNPFFPHDEIITVSCAATVQITPCCSRKRHDLTSFLPFLPISLSQHPALPDSIV